MTDQPIDFDTHRILAMYADGVRVADIADEFSVTVNTIYNRMKESPKDYEAAKGDLAKMRNAKYRRAGSLAIDKQLKYLELMNDDDPDVLSNEMTTIIKLGKEAEKRADLNEGKATEITEHKGTKYIVQMPEGFEGKNIS